MKNAIKYPRYEYICDHCLSPITHDGVMVKGRGLFHNKSTVNFRGTYLRHRGTYHIICLLPVEVRFVEDGIPQAEVIGRSNKNLVDALINSSAKPVKIIPLKVK